MELNEVKSIGLSALYDAVERNALEDAIAPVEALLGESWLNAANRRALTGLHFQLRVKLLAFVYLSDGYCAEDGERLAEELSAMYMFACENEAERMKAMAVRLQLYFNEVGQIMRDADRQAARIRDDDWHAVSHDLQEIREVGAFFSERMEQIDALSDESPFGDYAFPDIKAMLRRDLGEVRDFAIRTADQMCIEGSRQLLDELLTPVEPEYHSCEYCPVIAESEHAYAGTVVISTPFADELALFAVCYGKQTGTEVAILDVARLNGKKEGVTEMLLSAISKKGEHLLLLGMDRYREDRRSLLARVLSFGKHTGKKVFVMDERGDQRLYQDFLDYIRTDGSMTPMDVAFLHLALPGYEELTALLEEKGMLSGAIDREKVKIYLPFAGFVGLNRAIAAWQRGRDWLEAARRVSELRHGDGVSYLAYLPTQSLLLSTDWGDYKAHTFRGEVLRAEMSYDDVRDVNPENIRRIVEGNYTIFEKCGLVCRYCLTHGEDVSVWRELKEAEVEKRLTQALRLVMRILGVSAEPVVTIHESIPNAPKATSLCVGGGKEIQYKRSALADLTETIDVVCHESYHAFQSYAIHSSFSEWFWRELGVTRGRIQGWAENQSHYFGSSDKRFGESAFSVYHAQVLESDARAFAVDCVMAAETGFEKIDWE